MSAAASKKDKPDLSVAKAPPDEQEVSSEPILSLSTIAPDRPVVDIDGNPYEMAVMDDFGIVDQQALSRDGGEFSRLWSKESELSKHERSRLKMLLDRQFEKVLPGLPVEVAAKVTDGSRARVVLTFQLAPWETAQTEMETPEPGDSSTTES